MKTRCSVALVAGISLLSSLVLTCLPAHAILLRYQPNVGEVAKHKGSIAGRVEVSITGMGAEGMDQPMRGTMSGTMEYAEKALSQTEETTRIENRMLGGQMTVDMMGQSQTIDLPTMRTVTDVDRRGRFVELIEADLGDMPGADQVDQMLGPGGDAFTQSPYQFSAFPEGEVNVDDTWSDELKLPAEPGGPDISLKYTSRLVALTTFQGRKCAKIETTFKGPLNLDLGALGAPAEEIEGQMEATLEGSMLYYYDHESSIYVHAEGSIGMHMTMSMAGPDVPAGTMTTNMLMNIKITLAE